MMQAVADVMPVSTELPGLITTSAITVALIQWVKNTKWIPFVNQHSSTVNRIVGWCAAFVTAAGLHYTWDAGTGTLTLTNLHLINILHAAGDTTKSYAFQWLIYKGIVQTPARDVAAVTEGVPARVVVPAGAVVAASEQGPKSGQ